jgi:hypothetical protein
MSNVAALLDDRNDCLGVVHATHSHKRIREGVSSTTYKKFGKAVQQHLQPFTSKLNDMPHQTSLKTRQGHALPPQAPKISPRQLLTNNSINGHLRSK